MHHPCYLSSSDNRSDHNMANAVQQTPVNPCMAVECKSAQHELTCPRLFPSLLICTSSSFLFQRRSLPISDTFPHNIFLCRLKVQENHLARMRPSRRPGTLLWYPLMRLTSSTKVLTRYTRSWHLSLNRSDASALGSKRRRGGRQVRSDTLMELHSCNSGHPLGIVGPAHIHDKLLPSNTNQSLCILFA